MQTEVAKAIDFAATKVKRAELIIEKPGVNVT